MTRQQITIRKFLNAATPDEARAVAKVAKTSVAHLRHIAHGRRGISCDLAWRLEIATHNCGHGGTELFLSQQVLCAACGTYRA
jgi:hypothetical protein